MPESPTSWILPAVIFLTAVLMYALSLSRSALSKIRETDKTRAAISSAEFFLTIIFVFSAFALVKSGDNVFSEECALFEFYGDAAFQYAVLFVLTAFVPVMTVEIPARIYSGTFKEKFLRRTKPLVKLVSLLFSPLTFVNASIKKQTGENPGRISIALDSDSTKTGEKEMLRNILQFGDTRVRDIMTPRHEIVGVEQKEKFSRLKRLVSESNYSRIPVFEHTPDSIYGIIHVKDLLKYLSRDDNFDWTRLVRKITYVSENKKISDLLKVFQQKKIHMAAVSDEYGGISGLITMQDILEEIVGEINDEFDETAEVMFKKIDETYYIFDGRIMLGEFCRTLLLEDDFFDGIKGDAESLAGLLLEIRGEFPASGEKIPYKKLTFIIEAFNHRRIEKIGVKISEK